jgi:hypothetical protein
LRPSGSPRTIPATSNSEKIVVSASASLASAPRGRVLSGDAALDVGDRKANGLGAEVNADQARLGRKAEGEIFDRDRAAHRRERAIMGRPTSRLTAWEAIGESW